jgi:hypothetical protein
MKGLAKSETELLALGSDLHAHKIEGMARLEKFELNPYFGIHHAATINWGSMGNYNGSQEMLHTSSSSVFIKYLCVKYANPSTRFLMGFYLYNVAWEPMLSNVEAVFGRIVKIPGLF